MAVNDMTNLFFERPILNSPYEYPARHWELDADSQPTQVINPSRRPANFITPIPKPHASGKAVVASRLSLIFDEGKGLSTQEQQYDHTAVINGVRKIDAWRRPASVAMAGHSRDCSIAESLAQSPALQHPDRSSARSRPWRRRSG
ncbi:MAG: hypothetical protein R3F22_04680 [Lysobacteraceae bacterium]